MALGRPAHIHTGSAGVGPDGMDVVEVLTHDELELLLAGRVVPGRADLDRLAGAVAELRDRVEAEPVPPMGIDLRIDLAEAEVQGRRLSMTTTTTTTAAPPPSRHGRPARRLSLVAAAAVSVALGIGATHTSLPGGLQEIASSAAKQLGITLPASAPAPGGPAGLPGQPGPEVVEVPKPGSRASQRSPAGPTGPAVVASPVELDGDVSAAAPGQAKEREPTKERDGLRDDRREELSPAPPLTGTSPDPTSGSPGQPATPGPDPAPAPRAQPHPGAEDPAAAPPGPSEGIHGEVVDESPPAASHPSDRRPDHAPGPSSTPPGGGGSGPSSTPSGGGDHGPSNPASAASGAGAQGGPGI